ncbi:MAG: HAMP domain-containing protein [Planctomycetales bacterium]|nr:HAMP domain-containing protein [Planctomycetales bacterium]
MWSSKLFWKLFLVIAGVNIAVAVGMLVFVSRWHRDQINEQVYRMLRTTCGSLSAHLEGLPTLVVDDRLDEYFKKSAMLTGLRITLVAADGVVLADTDEDPKLMENHRERPELRQAAREGVGQSSRLSPTLDVRMVYFARRIQREGEPYVLIRVATGVAPLEREVAAVQGVLWSFVLVVSIAAMGLSYAIVGRIIRPLGYLKEGAQAIAAGDYSHLVPITTTDELGDLAEAFNRMRSESARQVSQLRENGERLATVLGSMVEGVIAIDASGRLLLANDASRRLLSLPPGKIEGKALADLTRIPEVHDAAAGVFESEKPTAAEFEVSGKTRRVLSLRADRLPGSPCPGAVLVLHDMSDLRRLENLRREFLANVSHELKTPLASIRAYAETLRLGALNDPENNHVFLERIEDQADRLLDLILDMLQLARVEAGQTAFEIVDVSVAKVADHCLALHQENAAAKNIELVVEPPEDAVMARVDEEGLETILDNLVSNAIKYTPNGGSVRLRWSQADGQVLIEVEDDGIGIPSDAQSRVFERFFRVDKARSRELGGTGLGLSIVKHLTQSFGGNVGLSSRLGSGSTFKVSLPAAM